MKIVPAALVALGAMLVLPLAGVHGTVTSVTPLPQSFCSPVVNGAREPQLLITSDFPIRSSNPRVRAASKSMSDAVEFMLERRKYQAGAYAVGYQACDDSTPQESSGDLAKCASNAKAYAAEGSVIGVVGTWSSRCSGVELPILNGASSGSVVLVSPSNTSIGLTHAGIATDPGEPGRYYPTGKRSFARVISPDDAQGVADALLAKQVGVKRVFVLNDRESYGLTVATPFLRAARGYGLRIAGTGSWDVDQTRFGALARKVARSGANGVFLGGFACPACGSLLKELRAALGRKATIIAPDGFSDLPALVKAAGVAATEGLYVSLPGLPASSLSPLGRVIAKKFGPPASSYGGPPYAAQAIDVLLDAIAASDGTRASVTKQLLRVRVRGGIIGTFGFDKNGDPTLNPATIFRVHRGVGEMNRVVSPRQKPGG